ncbi:MAG: hypothetical protein AVDCRST_MAG20-289, partial [uncultured Acidimicrobiales bacterium]
CCLSVPSAQRRSISRWRMLQPTLEPRVGEGPVEAPGRTACTGRWPSGQVFP